MTTAVPTLRRLLLKRFRSVSAVDVEFNNPIFLVGQNGSGKSSIADAFKFLSESMVVPLQVVFSGRGGTSAVRNRISARSRSPDLGIGVELSDLNGESISARYAFELRLQGDDAFEVLREQCIVDRPDGGRVWFDRDRKRGFRNNVERASPALDAGALALH